MSHQSNGDQPWLNPHLREKGRQRLKDAHYRLDDIENEKVRELVQELELHRAELGVQNEELRQAQQELTRTRDAYRDLFERAPVGYLILDNKGLIHQANLRSEDILEAPRSRIEGAELTHFVAAADQDAWFLFRRSLVPGIGHLVEELTLANGPQAPERIVRLEAVEAPGSDPDPPFFSAVPCRTSPRGARRNGPWSGSATTSSNGLRSAPASSGRPGPIASSCWRTWAKACWA